jgi:hypothetical protein
MLEILLKRNLAHRLAKPCVPRIGSESLVPDHLRQASARPDFVHARRYPRVFRLRQGAGNGSAPPDEMPMERIAALGPAYGLEFLGPSRRAGDLPQGGRHGVRNMKDNFRRMAKQIERTLALCRPGHAIVSSRRCEAHICRNATHAL